MLMGDIQKGINLFLELLEIEIVIADIPMTLEELVLYFAIGGVIALIVGGILS